MEENKRPCHVYVIRNIKNKEIYIGKTIQEPWKRWRHHQFVCQNRGRYERFFDTIHDRMEEFGIAWFTFEVIRTFDSEEIALKFEEDLVKKFLSSEDQNVRSRCINSERFDDQGNRIVGKGRRSGFKHDPETKKKMRETRFKNKLREAMDRLKDS